MTTKISWESHFMDQAVEEYEWFSQLMPHYVALAHVAKTCDVSYLMLSKRITAQYPERVAAAREDRRNQNDSRGVTTYAPIPKEENQP